MELTTQWTLFVYITIFHEQKVDVLRVKCGFRRYCEKIWRKLQFDSQKKEITKTIMETSKDFDMILMGDLNTQ